MIELLPGDLKRVMKKKLLIIIADILAVILSYGIALWLRFDLRYSAIPKEYIEGYLIYLPVAVIVTAFIYHVARLYSSIWSYAGISEVLRVLVASISSALVTGTVTGVLLTRMPVAYYLIGWLMLFLFTGAIRLSYRLARRILNFQIQSGEEGKNVMIIGAGAAGRTLVREYQTSQWLSLIHI